MTTRSYEVILTHEHTDFDALASLFAAALLFPGARPVLPYQLNRNVQEFLALYRNQFPFVQAKELPRGAISRTILVDTRTANFPKGVKSDTPGLVIDHHQIEEGVPAHWQLWSELVGANTTLLVEKVQAQGSKLNPVQATLLALGIHEDTGSLTYGGATPRDAHALAWLMEPAQGANQAVINQFLRHPLSPAQRALLEILVNSSEFLEVAGHTVVIAQADAPEYVDELSTLAHRLRDIHDADTIFLLVGLGDIVQMVARSTGATIDVGAVARALGGGGHARAAAAPIHQTPLAAVRDQLVALVQRYVQPAVTVRQIMSLGRPQVLHPDLSIQAALVLMQRYGHEGFPVVAPLPAGGESLHGVLTRREADRALNHGLGDAPVRRFMQAGQVTVRPTDSIATLRKVMVESNWGQVPVVDEQGSIIGIVTRTDLIKLWGDQAQAAPSTAEVDQRLRALLAPAQLALLRLIGRIVASMNYTAYIVGGFVRDLLLNGSAFQPTSPVATLDLDIVIEGDAIAFARQLEREYGGRVVAHKRFGTAKWLLADPAWPVQWAKLLEPSAPGGAAELPPTLDFVTARTEFYTAPSALPTVELSNIKLDLHRRDFTINTLAICLTPERWGELLDFYGGVNDLQQGVVRVLHSLSFVDDPTRILRAVRYEQRFGFQIDPRTLELLNDALELLERLTPARLRHELERIFQETMPEKAFQRLHELGVLTQIHPALPANGWLSTYFARLRHCLPVLQAELASQPVPLVRLYWGVIAWLLPDAEQVILHERLQLDQQTVRLMKAMQQLQQAAATLCDPQTPVSRLVAILDEIDFTAQALCGALLIDPRLSQVLTQYATVWRQVHSLLRGHDLQALGLAPGPHYSQILNRLRAARLDGAATTRADEIALVQRDIDQLALSPGK